MHHRAQCLNVLRRLEVPGVSDQLPDLDALEWQLKAGIAPTAGEPLHSAESERFHTGPAETDIA
jgi:hypothetical protein